MNFICITYSCIKMQKDLGWWLYFYFILVHMPLYQILSRFCPLPYHTAKTKCRKFETNIPRKGISGPQSQLSIPTFMCLRANYVFPRWVCLFCWRKYVDWSWEYINRSKTHECGNWGWGHAIPRKGICKRNCRCSVVHLVSKILISFNGTSGTRKWMPGNSKDTF